MTRISFPLAGTAFAALSLLALTEPSSTDAADRQTRDSLKSESGESVLDYWIALPPDPAAHESWPLLVFLHGAGERGDDLELVKKHGPPKIVGTMKELDRFIVVSPQCATDQRWQPAQVKALIEKVAGEHPVDRSRIYLTGLSMGGFGTWATLAEYPDLVAAAIPICGRGDPAKAESVKRTPVWAFHGDKDEAVPVEGSTAIVEAVKAAGGEPKLTIYEGVGHDSWTQTYANPAIYEWLLKHKRE